MDRRRFLKYSGAGMLSAGLSQAIPGFAAGASSHYRLAASEGAFRFDPTSSTDTSVMFYNQSIPGPVLKLARGRESVIEFHNKLREPSSVHWHGLRIANAMDGVPGITQAAVEPGERFEYRFTPPDAGTYWYHSHKRSWAQMAMGLAGVLIVEEANPPQVDQDLIFAIDDWRLNEAMQVDQDSFGSMHDWSHGGRMGNWITVNGEFVKSYPVASGERLRLRLVNIANSRIMTLLFNQVQCTVIALDGQPLKPYALESNKITLAPGQRADLMVDVTAKPESSLPIELLIRDQAYEIANFKLGQNTRRETLLDTPMQLQDNPVNHIKLPDQLLQIPLVMAGGAMGGMAGAIYQGKEMGIRELIENGQVWAINGIAGLPDKPLFSVKRGTAVELKVENDNAWPHAMHIHGHHFIDERTPGIWRDTALFNRQQSGSLKFIADNPGKWLVHCHMVEHMAGGMVTWFEVS